MTREEFEDLKIGDNVAVGDYPSRYLVGVVIRKDDMTYDLQSKFFSPQMKKDSESIITFAWNENNVIKDGNYDKRRNNKQPRIQG